VTTLVDPSEIERIVGRKRSNLLHYARLISEDGMFYIMHSLQCVEFEKDLRECPYSLALDEGVDPEVWRGWIDKPAVLIDIQDGRLVPVNE
jgi:hypothetical protein